MTSSFDEVIRQFHKRRLEKEIYSEQIRLERLRYLQDLADIADCEMRQRRRQRRKTVGE